MQDDGLKVFISYSRTDSAFTDDLLAALGACGFTPVIDRRDIAPGEAWEKRLEELIRSADAVVAILSPAFLQSDRCAWELATSRALGKRLLQITFGAIAIDQLPDDIRRYQIIPFAEVHAFGRRLADLVEHLRVDIEWIREHTRLGEMARRWNVVRRNDLLLRGSDISVAEQWLIAKPAGNGKPTELHEAFIRASRIHAARERSFLIGGLATGLVLAIAIASIAVLQSFRAAYLQREAEAQRNAALVVQSNFLAERSQAFLVDGDVEVAILLALEALPDAQSLAAGNPDRPLVASAQRALYAATTTTHRESALFSHPDGYFWRATFDATGTRILTVAGGKSIQVRDASDGHVVLDIRTAAEKTNVASFSPDGRWIVYGTGVGDVVVADSRTGTTVTSLKLSDGGDLNSTREVAVSGDGRFLIAYTDQRIRIWRTVTWEQAAAFDFSTVGTGTIGWGDADGGLVVAYLEHRDGLGPLLHVRQIGTSSREVDIAFDDAETYSKIRVEDRGETILSDVGLVSSRTTRTIHPFTNSTTPVDLGAEAYARTPDGSTWILATGTYVISGRNARTGQTLFTLPRRSAPAYGATFSPDGESFVLNYIDGQVDLHRTSDGTLLARLTGHLEYAREISFSRDGKHLLTASDDGSGRIWTLGGETRRGHYLNTFTCERFTCDLLLTGNGDRLIDDHGDDSIIVRDARTFELLRTIPLRHDTLASTALTKDDRYLVIAYQRGTVDTWNIDTGALVSTFEAASEIVDLATFSDSDRAVAAASDGRLHLFNPPDGKNIGTVVTAIDDISGLAGLRKNSRIVVQSKSGPITIWDADTHVKIATLNDIPESERQTNGQGNGRYDGRPAFSSGPDDRVAVTDATGRIILIIDIADGKVLQRLVGHRGYIEHITFSRDGRYVFSTAELDNDARLWDVASGTVRHTFEKNCGDLPSCDFWLAQFSPDGGTLVTSRWKAGYTGAEVIQIDVARGEILATMGHAADGISALAYAYGGKSVLIGSEDRLGFSRGHLSIWPVFPDVAVAITSARKELHRCLWANQRTASYLPPEPQEWCLAAKLWPYDGSDWQAWRAFKQKGETPPLPIGQAWGEWLAEHSKKAIEK